MLLSRLEKFFLQEYIMRNIKRRKFSMCHVSEKSSRRTGSILVLTAGISWGMISIFTRALDELGLSALDITSLRAMGTGTILAVWSLLFNRSSFKIAPRNLCYAAGCGLLSIVCFNLCYFAALKYTTVNIAVVLLYTSPVFVTLLAALCFKEKFTRSKVLALIAVTAGCISVSGALSSGSGKISPAVLLLGLGSGFCYALFTIFGRFAQIHNCTTAMITLWSFLFAGSAGIFLFNWHKFFDICHSGKFWGVSAGLILIATLLPYCAYTAGLRRLTPTVSAVAATIEPVVGTVVGICMFGEKLDFSSFIGMCLILGTVFFFREKSDTSA